jgi:hypothetical protein
MRPKRSVRDGLRADWSMNEEREAELRGEVLGTRSQWKKKQQQQYVNNPPTHVDRKENK